MLRLSPMMLALVLAACGDKKAEGTGDKEKTTANAEDTAPAGGEEEAEAEAEAEAGAAEAEAGAAEAGEAEAGAAEAGEAEAGDAEAGDAEAGAGEAGEAAEAGTAEGDAEAGEEGEDPEDVDPIPGLLTEVKNKKTKDDRAMAALGEAKEAGAKDRDLAVAATKRGKSLSSDPERATKFFEYAQDIDKKYPDATFELAKITVNTGEAEKTIELLEEVKKRGGKKLLKNVEFDPTFALVANEPAVQKLLK